MSGVLVVGDACVDLVTQMPERSGDHPDNPAPELHGGGTGANTAVALARLGVKTSFIGTVGDDGYGRFLADDFEDEGISTAHLLVDRDSFTSVVLAMIDPQGERTLFGWPRKGAAYTQMRAEQITASVFEGIQWVHTTGMCLAESPVREAVLHAMQMAQERGITVSLDLNLRLGLEKGRLDETFRSTITQAIDRADIVLGAAEEEIAHLSEQPLIEMASRELAEEAKTVVARLGAGGALAVTAHQMVHAPAFPVQIVDTLGAGDAFNGGFISAQMDGKSLEESLRWGNAVAALKISRAGARAVPRREELTPLLGA